MPKPGFSTITIDNETKRKLDEIKRALGLLSYNDVLKLLANYVLTHRRIEIRLIKNREE